MTHKPRDRELGEELREARESISMSRFYLSSLFLRTESTLLRWERDGVPDQHVILIQAFIHATRQPDQQISRDLAVRGGMRTLANIVDLWTQL